MRTPRTLFGYPVRYTTLEYHPNPLTLDQFAAWMEGGADGYVTNMRCQPTSWAADSHYIEEWIESWLAWSEIETD